ncbi:ash family protein [Salmonella enterica]|nr:ash family protein [Salmonella enterica]EGL8402758.1 ash family protein [Salmonella enterica]EGL8449196.1 ash family protein [Salmonella enterica]EGL8485031.1 ash family protein [Salmonella enterica]EGL8494670.1 ash family protein [Salmonella enterica]
MAAQAGQPPGWPMSRDQLQMLHDVFEEAEVRRIKDEKLPL